MNLAQSKLDVLVKKRSNIFNWRGQFTPEFAAYILQEFTQKGDFVLDPFSGSGTVLQEAARLDLEATGLEINPAAQAMSSFFSFSNLDFLERHHCCNTFEIKLNVVLNRLNGQKVFVDNPDYRMAYTNLLGFAKDIINLSLSTKEEVLLLNLLFKSEKDKGLLLKDSIQRSFKYIKNALLGLPYTEQSIHASLNDARMAGSLLENQVNFILTSPPYINVFNYHQNHRAIVEIFQFDLLKVAHSEFGSNRKNRGNRFKTVIQYTLDMELAIRSFWKALKSDGTIILVLGRESNVRGVPFYNGEIVIEILGKCGGFKDIRTLERQFVNKFGNNIKEDIIIGKKMPTISKDLNGRDIALFHLSRSLDNAPQEIQTDIIEAINSIASVHPSPILNPENIISK